jgi:RRXRR protein
LAVFVLDKGKTPPVSAISIVRVRFDTQALENSEILGVEYQQGTLGCGRTAFHPRLAVTVASGGF